MSNVKSPCNLTCVVDRKSGICIGCKRKRDEIANWVLYSDKEKLEVLKKIKGR